MSATPTHSPRNFRFVSRDDAVLAEVQELLASWNAPFGIQAEFRDFAGRSTYFKGEPLQAWPRLRHAARRLFLGRPHPRLAEFENLEWLAAHDFHVPKPLVAGVRRTWNGVSWQFLVTERVRDVQPVVVDGNDPPDDVLQALALEVARLHDLGFVHRDLHLRNLAWRTGTHAPEIVFFDAWRGGARLQSRGIAYDLACLVQGLAHESSEACAARFLELYLPARFPRSVARQDGLRGKTARQRKRLQRRGSHRSLR